MVENGNVEVVGRPRHYFPGVCVPLGWQLRRRSSSDAVELAANHHEWHPFAPAVPDIEGDADERNEARKGGPDR